ncbi:DnaJ/Hsp40 cysteine-rich domain superfamily protein [Abeliophyllum distichum]|uniref:DnaJ/Hsp40 cysteine-rich domain superfamily protein n=1 Tax=Abeliophyllum distichum TaxID=126358 RepID=A0ABD1TFR1_9LAMI
MAVITSSTSLLAYVRSEATSNGVPTPQNQNPPTARPLLSLSKPSWVVRTESNVRKEKSKPPDPPCVVCRGSGRVDCHDCRGRGRTNHIHLTMLPKGEWPKWCRGCGGSGLGYCSRCLGTGEYRYIMGFQFMKRDTDYMQNNERYEAHDKGGSYSSAELLLNDDQSDSGCER